MGDEPAWTPESKERGIVSGLIHILPGYFETVGIRLVRGRLPDWADVRSRTEIAVVSESAARSLLESAIQLALCSRVVRAGISR